MERGGEMLGGCWITAAGPPVYVPFLKLTTFGFFSAGWSNNKRFKSVPN